MLKFSRAIAASPILALAAASSVFAQATPSPTLTVITPQESQIIYGDKTPILISTENFEIVDYQTNQLNQAGRGHVHLWLDDPNPTRESAVKLTSDDFTYQDVAYGDHELVAELVDNDHTPLTPPVTTTINFQSEQLASPTTTTTSGFDKNTALVILIVVAAIIVAAWWYTKDEEETTPTATRPTTKKSHQSRSRRK